MTLRESSILSVVFNDNETNKNAGYPKNCVVILCSDYIYSLYIVHFENNNWVCQNTGQATVDGSYVSERLTIIF